MLSCHGASTLDLRARFQLMFCHSFCDLEQVTNLLSSSMKSVEKSGLPHADYLQLLTTANGHGLCSRLGTLIREAGQLRVLLILSSTLGRDRTTRRLSMCLKALTKLSGQVLPLLLRVESCAIGHSKGFLIVSRHQPQLAAATAGASYGGGG